MQKQPKKIPEVRKPTMTGSWHGRDAVKLGLKLMLSILFVSLMYLLLSMLLSFDALSLRLLAGLILVSSAGAYLYYNGMNAGEADAAFGEIMHTREQEGKALSQLDRDRCFHPAKGFFAVLVGVAPYVMITLVFAFLTELSTYTLGALPSWLTKYTRQSGIGDALAYYQTNAGLSLITVLRIVVRSMTMPFMNIAVKMGDLATLWAERLTPLWVLVAPLGYGFGYMQGLNARARINTGIAIGVQKKKRLERKERRARTQKSNSERLI